MFGINCLFMTGELIDPKYELENKFKKIDTNWPAYK